MYAAVTGPELSVQFLDARPRMGQVFVAPELAIVVPGRVRENFFCAFFFSKGACVVRKN
jgi:hypothetical protein